MLAGNLSAAKRGMLVMLLFSLGLALPYLLLAVAFDKYFDKLKILMKTRVPQIALGVIMIFLGITIMTGYFTKITSLLYKIVPFKLPIGM